MSADDLEPVSLAELFARYGALLAELRRRGVIRTNNAPAGDWAEYLVWRHLGGTLEPNSNKSSDVTSPKFGKVQVKSRVVFDERDRGQRQLSSFRSFSFDWLAIILFDAALQVWRAVLMPAGEVERFASDDAYVRGNRLMATNALLASASAVEITDDLRRVAAAL